VTGGIKSTLFCAGQRRSAYESHPSCIGADRGSDALRRRPGQPFSSGQPGSRSRSPSAWRYRESQQPTPTKNRTAQLLQTLLVLAGDFDPNASDANGLANEFDVSVSTGAATYTPFIVPRGKTWTVTGLFTNNFMPNVLDPKISPYEIRKGIPRDGGNGGTLVCHGKKPATLKLAVIHVNLYIWATKVGNIKGCRLPSGKYWMSVVPYCTNKNDNSCDDWQAFLSNDDGAMAHRFAHSNRRTTRSSTRFSLGRFGSLQPSSSPASGSVLESKGLQGEVVKISRRAEPFRRMMVGEFWLAKTATTTF
jgi:hypothetical protein